MKKQNNDKDIADNLDNWNDRAAIHANGGYGDLAAFAANSQKISSPVQRDLKVIAPFLPDHSVKNQRLLHLQCHIGNDTISWARLGAHDVYGLDFSANALAYARKLAQKANVPVTYIQGDARFAADAMPNQKGYFDVIVTSVGTITWLPELESWAKSIAKLLRPGGIFMIRDSHPLLFALDNSGLELFRIILAALRFLMNQMPLIHLVPMEKSSIKQTISGLMTFKK